MHRLFLLFIFIMLLSCTESKSTSTNSSSFSSVEAKVNFLEKYVQLRSRNFEELDFHIFFKDNSGGMVPGPSDWDICFAAKIPKEELNQWVSGLKKIAFTPDTKDFEKVPRFSEAENSNEWFELSSNTVIGVNRKSGMLFFRSQTIK